MSRGWSIFGIPATHGDCEPAEYLRFVFVAAVAIEETARFVVRP